MNKKSFLAVCLLCGSALCALQEGVAFGPQSAFVALIGQSGELPLFSNSLQSHNRNPAALFDITGFECGAGYSTSSLTLFYNSKTAKKMATFGFQFDYGTESDENIASGTISISSSNGFLNFGIASRFMYGTTEKNDALFNMDLSAGLIYSIDQLVNIGLAVRNILGTDLLVNDSVHIEAERSASISAGTFLGKKKKTAVIFEAMLDSLNIWNNDKLGYAAGIEQTFLKENMLKIRAGYLTRKSEAEGKFNGSLLGGIGALLPFKGNQLRLEYGINLPVNGSGREIIHQSGITFRFQTAIDRIPPNVVLKTSDNLLILGTGTNNTLQFYIDADDHNGKPVKNWMLLIAEKTDNDELTHIKSWSGTGIPPRVIEWDGRDAAGDPVKKKSYCCRLHAEDFSGNITTLPCFEITVE
jgi:hypothetical protein